MKLITAIAALALLAGSMDVEAQKRGEAGNPPGGEKKPGAHQKAPGDAEEGKPQIGPLARFAIGTFNPLGTEECGDLAEEAKNGDEEALEALAAANVEALEEVLGGLQDEETLKWVRFGMSLSAAQQQDHIRVEDGQHSASIASTLSDDGYINQVVDAAVEQLENQLNLWSGKGENTFFSCANR